jgi:ABC-2 type transport system permease protein
VTVQEKLVEQRFEGGGTYAAERSSILQTPRHYSRCLTGIIRREALRWLGQRGRFVSALVRPLIWLIVFAAGFHFVLGVSISPPYKTYIPYEVYIAPGLVGMIQLFNGMQSSLSMVYDREMGSMRTLMVSPFPRWFLLSSKLLAGVCVSIVQAYIFFAIAWFWDIRPPLTGYIAVLPALILSGLMLGALGLVLSSFIKQLENFAGVMNFVIFPMFFTSGALYPLWRMQQASLPLYYLSQANPFTHAVEMIRFSLYDSFDPVSALVVCAYLALFMGLAIIGYDPGRGLLARRGGGE